MRSADSRCLRRWPPALSCSITTGRRSVPPADRPLPPSVRAPPPAPRAAPGAVLGARLFAGEAPEDFGTAARALVAVLRAASGDQWPPSLALAGEEGGLHWPACLYMGALVVVGGWVALGVAAIRPSPHIPPRVAPGVITRWSSGDPKLTPLPIRARLRWKVQALARPRRMRARTVGTGIRSNLSRGGGSQRRCPMGAAVRQFSPLLRGRWALRC